MNMQSCAVHGIGTVNMELGLNKIQNEVQVLVAGMVEEQNAIEELGTVSWG